ncbi:MAG: hypothetical protein K6G09_01380 [Treponema sp.]|nr:hypothetical protein [Treponema sp.]
MKKILCLSFLFCLAGGFAAFAQSEGGYKKFNGWKKAETEHFNFIFEEESRLAAEAYATFADDAWKKIAKIYAFPQDKTNVYVLGRTNTVNAYTFFSPTEIVMFNSPVITPDFGFRDDWMKLFFTHELIHIANCKFEDKKYLLGSLLGPSAVNMSFWQVPGWALEGLTTVLETELTAGGRGRSPYFELDYKAPTLENSFISYDEIGLDEEPPYAQIYVMGYLIMRSIADRWGLQALADIERNRSFTGSWEESVKLVTGQEAADIYKDVKIALAKKYAAERAIPEGIIISPRATGTFYYKPAIVFDDGTLIGLRSAPGEHAAVVKLDPSLASGRKYLDETDPEKDLNSVLNETILFTGDFSGADAVTADCNGTVYASMGIVRQDRNPGFEVEYGLYKWTQEDGMQRLTKDTSLFQPSVSRDGKTLIAVQQKGLHMQLVKVDTQTGDVIPLLSEENLSFVQPSVNADGSKLAFLILKNDRAVVAISDLSDLADVSTSTARPNKSFGYKIVANDGEKIYDPSYPTWNSDGKLTFTCNYRGRLEVFELNELNKLDEIAGTNQPQVLPVLSDPVGALWSYKTERGIYYYSQSSTGSVIKMKPLSEWGVVPDFDGPSPAGEIICFGHLENDYPNFKPYVLLSEVEIPENEDEEDKEGDDESKGNGLKGFLKNEKEEEILPKPIAGKHVKHRSKENLERADKLFTDSDTPSTSLLQNEKAFLPFPQPLLYFPFIDSVKTGSKDYLGFGYFFLAMTPRLQLASGIIISDIFYYPDLKNFTGDLYAEIPLGNTLLDFGLMRTFQTSLWNKIDSDAFVEENEIILGLTQPIIHRIQHLDEIDLSLFTSARMQFTGEDVSPIAINSKLDYSKMLNFTAGLDFFYSKSNTCDQLRSLGFTAFGMGSWDIEKKRFFGGCEFESDFIYEGSLFNYEVAVRGRYTDYPADTFLTFSRANYSGFNLDCTYPGRLIPQASVIIPDFLIGGLNLKVFGEMLFSFGKNTIDFETPDNGNPFNFTMDNTFASGMEIFVKAGRQELGFGYNFIFDLKDSTYKDSKFYLLLKYNWIRN